MSKRRVQRSLIVWNSGKSISRRKSKSYPLLQHRRINNNICSWNRRRLKPKEFTKDHEIKTLGSMFLSNLSSHSRHRNFLVCCKTDKHISRIIKERITLKNYTKQKSWWVKEESRKVWLCEILRKAYEDVNQNQILSSKYQRINNKTWNICSQNQ
jgi:hypothetical protein